MITAATLNTMVKFISQDKIYKEILNNITKNNGDAEDLFQEIMIMILEHKNPEFILEIYNKNQFKYFFIRMLQNQLNSKSNLYYHKYRKHTQNNWECFYEGNEELDNTSMLNDRFNETDLDRKELLEETLTICDNYLSSRSFYEKELFEMYYYQDKSYGQISKETKIPKTSVYKSITRTFEEIRNKSFNFNI